MKLLLKVDMIRLLHYFKKGCVLTMSKRSRFSCGIAFFLGFTGLLFLFFIFHITPFGSQHFLTSDLYHQYYIFHVWFGDVLRSGDWSRLLFDFTAGLGNPMLGTYAYYLSGPFSLLSVFFDENTMPLGITFILSLKIGCISASFYWFLTRYFKQHQTWYYLFSLFFAFSSFCITYLMNFMWLDQLIVLPLLCYSGLLFIHQNRIRPLFICLLLSFWVNFYNAYMAGIFLALFLLVEFFSHHSFSEWKQALKLMFKLAGLALLSFGLLAPFLIPTLLQLFTPGASTLSFNFEWVHSIFGLLESLTVGFYDGVETENIPPLYFGLFPLILALSFFFQPTIPLKERLLHLTLFIFLGLSFVFNPLYNFWHGFKSPAWFPGRHAFVFAFHGLYLASRTFKLQRKHPIARPVRQGLTCVFVGYLTLILLQTAEIIPTYFEYSDVSPLTISFLFLLLYSLLWCFLYQPNNKLSWRVLLYLGFFELFLATGMTFLSFTSDLTLVQGDVLDESLSISHEQLSDIDASSMFSRYHLNSPALNTSLLLGYPGVNSFNTLNHIQTIQVINHLTDHGGSAPTALHSNHFHPFVNSLLGVSYVVNFSKLPEFYLPTSTKNLYYNPYALPLGFRVNSELLTIEIEELNGANSQNTILNAMLGQSDDPINYIISTNSNLMSSTNLAFDSEYETFGILDDSKEASLTYHIYPKFDSSTYISFLFPRQNAQDITLTLNGKKIKDLSFSNLILSSNEVSELIFTCKANEDCVLTPPTAYQLDINSLKKALTQLQSESLQITEQNPTLIKGTITTKEDGLLFTSIPYNEGWSVTIDDQPTPLVPLIYRGFLGVELPAGTHHLTFTYTPLGFKEGCLFSLITLNGLTIYWICRKTFKKSNQLASINKGEEDHHLLGS